MSPLDHSIITDCKYAKYNQIQDQKQRALPETYETIVAQAVVKMATCLAQPTELQGC